MRWGETGEYCSVEAMLRKYIEEKELTSIIKEKPKWERISQLDCPLSPYSSFHFHILPDVKFYSSDKYRGLWG